MKKVFVWRNAFVCLLCALLTFALYQHFLTKRVSAQSTTSTRILIPYFSTTSGGYVSFLYVVNTSMDPYLTTATSGSCNADVYSNGTHYGPGSLGTIAPGGTSLISSQTIDGATGSALTNSSVRSYLFLTCNFPYAHAQVLLANPNGTISYFPGYIIPPNRSFSTGPEQLLQ